PHWHLLLFMRPEHIEQVRDILAYHARREDADELNSEKAQKARFHYEPIDPEKGSATGYIAKYISKNIDGYALDGEADEETGENLRDMAKAVSAWASRWRIRQFQQIGGAPVTVYRELRRLGDKQLDNAAMDAVLAAADVGDWAAYTQAQGGPLVSRDALVVRLSYEVTERANQYAEDVQKVQGVYSPLLGAHSAIITRTVEWKIVPKQAAASAGAGVSGGSAAAWSSVNNCTPGLRRRLSELLHLRGFPPDPVLVDVLIRGGNLAMSEGRALKMVNGRLEEVRETGDCELWQGWNWG
ncbi:replication endonuclease, partial [Dickeya dianthicola]